MSVAIVDGRGWQNTFDLKTGEKTEAAGPVVEMVRGALQRHAYPGDMDPQSNRWVSDTALDLLDNYHPRFVFLTYAAQYYAGRYTAMTEEARKAMIADAFREAERFINQSGVSAIVVGTGDMTRFLGAIDVTGLDGLAICTHWSTRYAGLHEPSPADMQFLQEHPHIEKIIPRQEVASLFGGTQKQALRVPEYLMLARKGYAFKTITDTKKTPVMIPSINFSVPLHAPGCAVAGITGIRQAVEEELAENNVALIVMEGVGLEDFPWPNTPCANSVQWYYYEPGSAQYLTITSGGHRFFDYPAGYKYFAELHETNDYPFSGYFKSVPSGTLGGAFPGKSIAVGNRSMFMHMVAGADIAVECFARNLYNQGTMAVIHRENKP